MNIIIIGISAKCRGNSSDNCFYEVLPLKKMHFQGLAVRWMPMNKLLRRLLPLTENPSAADLLMAKVLDQLNFYESSSIPLDKGLYLGYVKMQSTVSQISVLVPENLPSVLPFVYIRENPHVSK